MSLAVYDAIRDFYGGQQLPANDSGVFFGFTGCTRSALEKAAELLRSNRGAWYGVDDATRNAVFANIASEVSAYTGADIDGVYKFCFWCFVAAKGDADINNWFAGGEFGRLDYWGKLISDTVTSKKEYISESIDLLTQETKAEKTIFGTILPVIGILGACYLVKKVLD